MKIFILCRGYPNTGDLYNYPFVHRRVVQYQRYGHDVQVFVLGRASGRRIFEGCPVETGDQSTMIAALSRFEPDCIAAHGLTGSMWAVLKDAQNEIPVFGWLHGSEILPYYKTHYPEVNHPKRLEQEKTFLRRIAFWRGLAAQWPSNLKLVLVSEDAARRALGHIGQPLPDGVVNVIHNPIDTDLFSYQPKPAELRFRVLSIRPFNNWTYGNDLTAAAIVKMSTHPLFDRFKFHIIGDGALFDQNLAPIRHFKNVTVERRFITQAQISELHQKNGVFLVPTRNDTQGVSRDEAMASGLVPVTNDVAAVPEFVSPDCGYLAARDDAQGLADAMLDMAQNPAHFLDRSVAASTRIDRQTAANIIIPAELALLEGKVK